MERWEGKVAVVTGASAGIGEAVSKLLVKHGMIVVGVARRENKLKELSSELEGLKGKFHPLKADISKEGDIFAAFSWIEKNVGGVHVLINNAGLTAAVKPLADGEIQDWRNVLDVNLLALTICSREALKSMKAHNIDDGHIINISSIAAHMSSPLPGYAMYAGSKRAVQAITEGMRVELAAANSKIKVTTICPGVVKTEVFEAGGVKLPPGIPYLESENIAETVVFCLQMPPSAQVTDLHIRPVGEDLIKFINALQHTK